MKLLFLILSLSPLFFNLISVKNKFLIPYSSAGHPPHEIDCNFLNIIRIGSYPSYGTTTGELKSVRSRPCDMRFGRDKPWYIYLTATYTSTYSTTSSILTSTEVDSETVSYTIFTIAPTDVPNSYYVVSQPLVLQLPLTFELIPSSIYNFVDGGEAVTTVIDNPYKSGLDTTNKVASYVITGFGRTSLTLTNPIDFSTMTTIKMLVWSPVAPAIVLLGFQNIIPDINTDRLKTAQILNANVWEELTFDFAGIVNSNNYQIIIFRFDYNTAAVTPTTFYFDNVRQV